MAYQSTNPYDGITLATFDEHDSAALEARLHAATDCFERDWRQRSYAERAVALKRAAALMRECGYYADRKCPVGLADRFGYREPEELASIIRRSAGIQRTHCTAAVPVTPTQRRHLDTVQIQIEIMEAALAALVKKATERA